VLGRGFTSNRSYVPEQNIASSSNQVQKRGENDSQPELGNCRDGRPWSSDSRKFSTDVGFHHAVEVSLSSRTKKSAPSAYVGRSDVIVICGRITISVLWGNTANCVQLSGQNLSRYSNKTESAALRKCSHYHYLTNSKVALCNRADHYIFALWGQIAIWAPSHNFDGLYLRN